VCLRAMTKERSSTFSGKKSALPDKILATPWPFTEHVNGEVAKG